MKRRHHLANEALELFNKALEQHEQVIDRHILQQTNSYKTHTCWRLN